jgi:hypothetical protein
MNRSVLHPIFSLPRKLPILIFPLWQGRLPRPGFALVWREGVWSWRVFEQVRIRPAHSAKGDPYSYGLISSALERVR